MTTLETLPALAADLPAYQEWKKHWTQHRLVRLEGLPSSAKPLLAVECIRETGKRIAIVSYTLEQAEAFLADLRAFGLSEEEAMLLPSTAKELFFNEGAPDQAALGVRASAMQRLAAGEAKAIVGPIAAWLQLAPPAQMVRERILSFQTGESVAADIVELRLTEFGYWRVDSVEQPGHWSRRGDIWDIFPPDSPQPVRIDLFGDEIESIRRFDPETQRSNEAVQQALIRPIREMSWSSEAAAAAVKALRTELPSRRKILQQDNLEERGTEHSERLEEMVAQDIASLQEALPFERMEEYLPFLYPDAQTALDYLSPSDFLAIDEPAQAKARWEQLESEMEQIASSRAARGERAIPDNRLFQTFSHIASHAASNERAAVLFSLLGRDPDGLTPDFKISAESAPMENFGGRTDALLAACRSWLDSGFRIVFVSEQPDRFGQLLASMKLPLSPTERLEPEGEGGIYLVSGTLASGFRLPEARLMLASDADVFGHRAHQKPSRRAPKDGMKIISYLELREGDYVVHIHHGISRYAGIARLKGSDGAARDYLLLEYAEGDKVYVPTDQVDRVQKYIGNQDSPPSITRLNSGDWARAAKRAKKQVQEMAAELIKLYAARKAVNRPALPPDTPWQAEMEDDFPFQETPDQLAAIEDVKKDLESDTPMDRLICGDVGYGKTEVAIRAAFKAAGDGRQVAVLCPTTILAQQHVNTFRKRLAAYPLRVELLSRFVTRSEAAQTMEGLADGTVDIVIGTHKLLGKEIKFRNLGLLVVDEEQRFGVSHKERIKNMRKSVDVLTLSATPIPRTLHMSLSGIRDMSLIDDPPEGRLAIKTYVKERDDELIREAILRELDRDGQVYFVHNRVESISFIAEKIRRLVPTAKVEYAHGQMHADDLEDVMARFADAEFNILVCTTIVESGLDISNVNTIIVDDADRLGLSQLYQIRGRIGRSRRQAYAYFLFRRDKVLTEVAEKRLSALREFSDLGSGYKVALRDLEIRGAGNLLGAEQSGTVAAVGFDLYTQLLSQAINELKGEDLDPVYELPNVALPLDAFIPESYIPSEAERIMMYKKLTAVRSMDHAARLQEELEDRYGGPPRSVWNLLAIMRLRLRCAEIGISAVTAEKRRIAVRFAGTHLTPDMIKRLSRAHMQHQFVTDAAFLAAPDSPPKMLHLVEEMVEVLAKALPPKLDTNLVKKPKNGVLEQALSAAAAESAPRSDAGKKPSAAVASKERNLVQNQVSSRRRGR